jgi:hypothetical protein
LRNFVVPVKQKTLEHQMIRVRVQPEAFNDTARRWNTGQDGFVGRGCHRTVVGEPSCTRNRTVVGAIPPKPAVHEPKGVVSRPSARMAKCAGRRIGSRVPNPQIHLISGRDSHGNAVGGIRIPEMAVPIAIQ